jgi:hypothetical protein
MTSKAATRKIKKNKRLISLACGVVVQPRVTQGLRRDLDQSPPPIMAARARRCDVDPDSVLHESDMGRCILALAQGEQRARLAGIWAGISAAHTNYRMRYIGQTGHPKGAASPILPTGMETNQSLHVDLRTPEEKDEAAKRVWADWQARLACLPLPQMRWAVRGALDGFLGDAHLWRDGTPTRYGAVAVHALGMLAR